MRLLNFSTVEELIFADQGAQAVLPAHYHGYYEQWKLAQRLPVLRQLGRNAVIDLLESLNDKDINALENYFGEGVIIEKINYHIVQHIKVPISGICDRLCEVSGFNYFTMWRDESHCYLSFWR